MERIIPHIHDLRILVQTLLERKDNYRVVYAH